MSDEEFEGYMNYGMLGKLKSENKWFSIEEFAALRPKQYSYVTENEEANKIFKKQGILMRGKGLSASSLIRYITHEMYVDQILKDQEAISYKMSNIQNKNFRMYTQYIREPWSIMRIRDIGLIQFIVSHLVTHGLKRLKEA